MSVRILLGDVREQLKTLPDESVHCVVTSPPYFGLRDYGVAGQIGLEPTPAEFVAVMVEVFREVRRVLRKDGTLWLNLGDSYAGGGNYRGTNSRRSVWTVATQPFKEAHFATFPPDLIEPCIKAGCPKGGTVLDPFGGAGTTGLVADRLQRDAILIELNPAYAEIARERIKGDSTMFAVIA
jgi:DNA modification methylase